MRLFVAAELPAAEKLRRATVAHLEAFDRHHPHLFVYLRETANLKGRFRASAQLSPKQYERFWQQILREGMKSGEFRADLDVQVVSYGLLGMLNWLYKWYDPNGRLEPSEIAAQFSALALSGLNARRGGPPRRAIPPGEPQDVVGLGPRRPGRAIKRSTR